MQVVGEQTFMLLVVSHDLGGDMALEQAMSS